MRRCTARVVLGFALLFLSSASCTQMNMQCAAGLKPMVQSTLYFGAQISSQRRTVDAGEWTRFVDETLVPHVPAGFTVLRGEGYWQNESGVTEGENSFVVVIVHPDDSEGQPAIDAVAREYRKRFDQQSVLRVDAAVCGRF